MRVSLTLINWLLTLPQSIWENTATHPLRFFLTHINQPPAPSTINVKKHYNTVFGVFESLSFLEASSMNEAFSHTYKSITSLFHNQCEIIPTISPSHIDPDRSRKNPVDTKNLLGPWLVMEHMEGRKAYQDMCVGSQDTANWLSVRKECWADKSSIKRRHRWYYYASTWHRRLCEAVRYIFKPY